MKRKNVLSPDAPDLTAEACAWLAQLETGRLSKDDMLAFREWIQRSPRHYDEIHRLANLSLEVNVLAGMADPLKNAAKRKRIVRRPGESSRIRSSVWRWSALGLVGTCAMGVALFSQVRQSAPVTPEPIYLVTAVGETQDVSLDDGSRVKLNTDSKIGVEFARERRSVFLEQGEAYFEVAHDTGRPFTVYAGDRSVTAVGTAFSVRWTDEEFTVTVSEGSVAYDAVPMLRNAAVLRDASSELPGPSSEKRTARTMLNAGQRLEISALGRAELVERLPENTLSRELAWRSGFLDFEDASLQDVVREMQRYTPERIQIADQAIADLRFGGVFRIGQTDAFFEALELSFGIEVERTGDNQLILRSAD